VSIKISDDEISQELRELLYRLYRHRDIRDSLRYRLYLQNVFRKLEMDKELGSRDLNRIFMLSKRIGLSPPRELMQLVQKVLKKEIAGKYENFEKEIIEILKSKEKINLVFLLGAGASNPPPSNIPTVNQMLNHIVKNLPPTEIPFASKVREWAKNGVNIEDVLTASYLSTLLVSNPSINRLIGEIIYRREEIEEPYELREREYVYSFQDLINRVFSMVSGIMAKAPPNDIHKKIAKLIKDNSKDGPYNVFVVTTNYDICLEKALQDVDLEGKYLGINIGSGSPIVKIHGSINWYYCEGCQEVITYSIDEIKNLKKIFPISGACQKCGTQASLFMVPPIAYKYVMYPPLIDIWQSAMKTFEQADIIVVIGYSFSLADDYILKMIVNALKRNNSLLVVINKDSDAIQHLEKRLSAYHLKVSHTFCEDAVECVPKIIPLFLKKISRKVKRKKT